MRFRDYVEDIKDKEISLEKLSSDVRSKLRSGNADSRELLGEEERLEKGLLELEKETIQMLSREVENRKKLHNSNKEFLEWYNSSVKDFSNLVEPFEELREGLNLVTKELRSVSMENGKVPLHIFEWEKNVLEPARKIGMVLDQIEEGRRKVLEDLDEPEKELVVDKDFVEAQKKDIKMLKNLVAEVESEEEGIEKIIDNNQAKLVEKFELEKKELKNLKSNLREIEKLEEEFEEYEREIQDQKRELTLLDIAVIIKDQQRIENKEGYAKRLAVLVNMLEGEESVEQSINYLEGLADKNKFYENEKSGKQIKSVKTIVEKVEEYLKTFSEATQYVNLGEIVKNRKKQTAKWVGKGAKDDVKNLTMTRRGLLKSAGALGLAGSLDILKNISMQKSADQDAFLSPEEISSANDAMIREVLNGNKPTIYIFDIYFHNNQPYLDSENAKNFIYNSLEGLSGANVEIKWIPIFATLERYLEVEDVSREELGSLDNVENIISDFEEVVKQYGVTEEIPERLSYYGYGGEDSSRLHETLYSHVLNFIEVDDKLFRQLRATENTIIFIGGFEAKDARGVSTFDSRGTGKYGLVKRYSNKSLTLNIAVHELGHKLRLPHTYTQGIMSYSIISEVGKRNIRVPFGPESKLNWRKVRRDHENFN